MQELGTTFILKANIIFLFMIHFKVSLKLGEQLVVLCDTAEVRIDPIPSNYRASIGNNNTNTFNLERQLM